MLSSMVVKVAINGYGTIGKRVADAIDAQDDMELLALQKQGHPSVVTLLFVKDILSTAPTMQRTKSLHLVRQGTTAREV